MNIKKFKVGDVITRNEPMTYKHNGSSDGSYLGERLVLLGLDEEAKIIFYQHPNFSDEPHELSYARDPWDEGWILYPQGVFESAKKKLAELTGDRPKKAV